MDHSARFSVEYRIRAGSKNEAHQFAEKIGTEQSVEMPLAVVPPSGKKSLPEVHSVTQLNEDLWTASLSYPISLFGDDITQFLNVLFGNISLLHNIKITNIDEGVFKKSFYGPEFGIEGLRKKLNVPERALSCTALKPIGLSPGELAENSYQFTMGGIDIIKDDHGLANQQTADFRARVTACVQAVRMGEQISGKKTLYFPNITTSPAYVLDRFHEALELGADGVLISPQLTGLEMLHTLSSRGHLPVMAHPAFSGPYVIHESHGFLPDLYYGKLWRALGADAIIYPNAGGRFSFSRETCKRINQRARDKFHTFNASFPTPAGGMNMQSLPDQITHYGNNTIYLIGGNLHEQKAGLQEATKQFQNLLSEYE